MYFPHPDEYENLDGTSSGDCEGYWLASPSAGSTNGVHYVCYDGNVYDSFYFSTRYGVRPVVSLTSGISAKWEDGMWKLQGVE